MLAPYSFLAKHCMPARIWAQSKRRSLMERKQRRRFWPPDNRAHRKGLGDSHSQGEHGCPLYPRKRTLLSVVVMSALCQKRTFTLRERDVANRSGRNFLRTNANARFAFLFSCDATRSGTCLKNDLDRTLLRRFASAIPEVIFSSLPPSASIHIAKLNRKERRDERTSSQYREVIGLQIQEIAEWRWGKAEEIPDDPPQLESATKIESADACNTHTTWSP